MRLTFEGNSASITIVESGSVCDGIDGVDSISECDFVGDVLMNVVEPIPRIEILVLEVLLVKGSICLVELLSIWILAYENSFRTNPAGEIGAIVKGFRVEIIVIVVIRLLLIDWGSLRWDGNRPFGSAGGGNISQEIYVVIFNGEDFDAIEASTSRLKRGKTALGAHRVETHITRIEGHRNVFGCASVGENNFVRIAASIIAEGAHAKRKELIVV